MAAKNEQIHSVPAVETTPASTLRDILSRVPSIIDRASYDVEQSGVAKTPEGKFALTYLIATREALKPALDTITSTSSDLLDSIGGDAHNPERTIDVVGANIATELTSLTQNLPNIWIRTEESAEWTNPAHDCSDISEGQYFAIIDPLDETNALAKGLRLQTTAIAVYNKEGNLLTIGIMSLVDDKMMFFEHPNTLIHSSEQDPVQPKSEENSAPFRIATMTRRMHALRDLPLFQYGATWAQDSFGGYSLLSMGHGEIDVMLDPIKGNPWLEYVLWGPAAEKLGFIVTDPQGNPIDTQAIMRTAITSNLDAAHRIPFVVSRTPQIHTRVLSLLKP